MKYYAIYNKTNETLSKAQCKCLNIDCENIEVSQDVYNNLDRYIYQDGLIVENPNYEEQQKQKERERLDMLYLTGADVERGIYQAKGMDFEDIIAMVIGLQQAQDERVANLDLKALKIELKANNFYRGNPYVDDIGDLLGFSSEQLDKFFETNDYKCLISEV